MTAGIVEVTGQQFRAFMTDRFDGKGPCRVQEDLPFATPDLPDSRSSRSKCACSDIFAGLG